MKKLQLITSCIEWYIFYVTLLLPVKLLDLYNSINLYPFRFSKNEYLNITLNIIIYIILALIIYCCLLFLININFLASSIISINTPDFMDNYFILMEGNPTDYSSGQPGPGSSQGGSSSPGRMPTGNNNPVPLAPSNQENQNQNENQQFNFYTDEQEDKLLKECMGRKLNNYRIANSHSASVFLDTSFTSAEHEYIVDKIFQEKAVWLSKSGSVSGANAYTSQVIGYYPERRYIGKVTLTFIERVFK